jgi:hypothetical protein
MDVRKSPAEAGLSRSLAFQTGLPARHDQRAQRRAQASAASPPTQTSSALLVAHAGDLRTKKAPPADGTKGFILMHR